MRVLDYKGDKKWQADDSGVFYAFSNDLESKYGNNLGSIVISVTRVS